MTPDDSPGAKSLGAHSDEEVRRLLAAAAAEPATMPQNVTARLDDVLAGLVADRATSGAAALAPVIDIEQRRASRWPKLLVAAAVVSVLGVGLANVLNQTGSSMSADSAKSADAGSSPGAESAPSQAEEREPQALTDALGERGSLDAGRSPRLRSSSVTVDAQRIADSSLPVAKTGSMAASPSQCRIPSTSKGDVLIAVRLDGAPATLVFRAGEDGRRLAEVFSCDDAESPVLTTTVDAP